VIIPDDKRRSRRKSGRSAVRKYRRVTEFSEGGNSAPEWHEFTCGTCKEGYSAFATKRELANPFVRLCMFCEVVALKVFKKESIGSYEA
jgi:hypothetical protein